jgi:hypothetical protein
MTSTETFEPIAGDVVIDVGLKANVTCELTFVKLVNARAHKRIVKILLAIRIRFRDDEIISFKLKMF